MIRRKNCVNQAKEEGMPAKRVIERTRAANRGNIHKKVDLKKIIQKFTLDL